MAIYTDSDISAGSLSISGQSVDDLTPLHATISLHGASHPRDVVEDECAHGTALSVPDHGHDRDMPPPPPPPIQNNLVIL